MKTCFKCKVMQPYTEFYKHPEMADGHLGKCKTCTKLDVKANYRNNHETYLAYEQSEARKSSRSKRCGENLRRHRKKYPEKNAARQAVSNAVRDGRLKKQPCAVCGHEKVEGHHADYSQPLLVVWLCHTHHREVEGRTI